MIIIKHKFKKITRSFFYCAQRLLTPQEHKHSLRGAVGKVGVAGPSGV